MRDALKAGTAYFAVMFGIGFALGTVRVLLLEGRMGALAASAVEIPVMLALSWVVCDRLRRRWLPDAPVTERAVMGASAFALLIAAETALGVGMLGRTIGQQFATYGTAAGALGLAAQLVFAAFPVIQGRRPPSLTRTPARR